MDHIAFVKVSLEEAKATLDNEIVPANSRPRVSERWSSNQRAAKCDEQELSAETFKWLASLPANVQPRALGLQYPRIANRLAEIWQRPLQCERYLDDLMIDQRGSRSGFPPEVAAEIAALKLHFLSNTSTIRYDVWDTRIGWD